MRTLTRRGAVGIVSALACLSTGMGFAAPAHADDQSTILPPPGAVVPLAHAGAVVGWGPAGGTTYGDFRLPADLQGVALTSVSLGGSYGIASTAAGTVVTWGSDTNLAGFPARLGGASVVQVAGGTAANAAAVTADGKVIAYWGGPSGVAGDAFSDTSALTDVAAISLAAIQPWGVARTRNGGVQVWGSNALSAAVTSPPVLSGVTSVAACQSDAMAVTGDGAVHVWGAQNAFVAAAPASGVEQAVCHGNVGLALNVDGTLTTWGVSPEAIPSDLQTALQAGDRVIGIVGGAQDFAVLDSRGKIWVWGGDTLPAAPVPTSLADVSVAELTLGPGAAYALVTKVLPATKPTVTGTVKVGQTLTAKAGTFSGTPDSVTGQWLANGSPIAGATGTTYTVKAGDVGKTISYRSTAKTGSDSVSSDSAPTAKVPAVSGGTVSQQPGGNGSTTPAVQQNPKLIKDLAKLKKDQAKLKKAKKAKKKAHGAKKAKLQKKIKKLKKKIKADKKHIRADK